jgi:hypothetical protein
VPERHPGRASPGAPGHEPALWIGPVLTQFIGNTRWQAAGTARASAWSPSRFASRSDAVPSMGRSGYCSFKSRLHPDYSMPWHGKLNPDPAESRAGTVCELIARDF